MLCNGTQGVGALVAKSGGIRLCADAKAVEDDQKYTFFHIIFSISSGAGVPDKVTTKVILLTYHYKRIPHRMQGLFDCFILRQTLRCHAEVCTRSTGKLPCCGAKAEKSGLQDFSNYYYIRLDTIGQGENADKLDFFLRLRRLCHKNTWMR